MTRALIVLALALAAAPARADDIALPRTKAVLTLPSGWHKLDVPGLLAAYRRPDGLGLAITRAQVPNFDAWRSKTREAYVEHVERGAIGAVPGAKKLARKLGEANGVPALDLELRRPDGSAVVLRVLLFRSYSLAIAIDVPKGKSLGEARAITTKLAPPKQP